MTGWYRQRLGADVAPAWMVSASANVTLSVGVVAGEDGTHLNGVLLGHSARAA